METNPVIEKGAQKFYQLATMALSTLCGILIALPTALSSKQGFLAQFALIAALGSVGFLIGRKRKDSRLFFYLSLICCVILITLLCRQS
ncbi:MAG: hypothetical protein D6808_00705 [Candidatus Dadabacteria bacterium]|nr:MAG: hypothetical protein D6808_00705 [Candidatus Dadabacteria bacterium]